MGPDGNRDDGELDAQSLAVYRTLVQRPEWTLVEVARHLDVDEAAVHRHVAALVRIGLLTRSSSPGVATAAVMPNIGLALMAERAVWEVQQRTAELERAGRDMTRLLREIARPDTRSAREVVHRDSLVARYELMARQCESELLVFLNAEWRSAIAPEPRTADLLHEAVSRGVRVCVVVESSGADADWVQEAALSLGRGAQWRMAASLPLGMAVADRRAALMSCSDGSTAADAVLEHQEATVAALSALFDTTWQLSITAADDVADADEGADGAEPGLPDAVMPPSRARVAQLLATGAKDEAVARHLGVSVRTLTRLTADLCSGLNARTRFQAGVLAARKDLA